MTKRTQYHHRGTENTELKVMGVDEPEPKQIDVSFTGVQSQLIPKLFSVTSVSLWCFFLKKAEL